MAIENLNKILNNFYLKNFNFDLKIFKIRNFDFNYYSFMLIISEDQDILYNQTTGGSGAKPPKIF